MGNNENRLMCKKIPKIFDHDESHGNHYGNELTLKILLNFSGKPKDNSRKSQNKTIDTLKDEERCHDCSNKFMLPFLS